MTRRIISALLCLALVLTFFPFAAFADEPDEEEAYEQPAPAEEYSEEDPPAEEPPVEEGPVVTPKGEDPLPFDPEDALPISDGVITTVDIETYGSCAYFVFTPEETGKYLFYSMTDGDTFGLLYDSDLELICDDDDGGENVNFRIVATLEAGGTYYFGARYLSYDRTGSFDIILERFLTYELPVDEPVTLTREDEGKVFDISGFAGYCTITAVGAEVDLLNDMLNIYRGERDRMTINGANRRYVSFRNFWDDTVTVTLVPLTINELDPSGVNSFTPGEGTSYKYYYVRPDESGFYNIRSDSDRVFIRLYGSDFSCIESGDHIGRRLYADEIYILELLCNYEESEEISEISFVCERKDIITAEPGVSTVMTLQRFEPALFEFTVQATGDYTVFASSDKELHVCKANDDYSYWSYCTYYYESRFYAGETYRFIVWNYGGEAADLDFIVEENDCHGYDEIYAGYSDTVGFDRPGRKEFFAFVPEETGIYEFTACGESYCQIDIQTPNSGWSETNRSEQYLKAGEECIYTVRFLDNVTGDVSVALNKLDYQPLSENVFVSGTLANGGRAYYSFVPEKDALYTFSASGEESIDYQIRYVENGYLWDHRSGNGVSTVPLKAGVEYYIDLINCGGEEDGNDYTLLLKELDAVEVEEGKTFNAILEQGRDEAYFRFECPETGLYSVTVGEYCELRDVIDFGGYSVSTYLNCHNLMAGRVYYFQVANYDSGDSVSICLKLKPCYELESFDSETEFDEFYRCIPASDTLRRVIMRFDGLEGNVRILSDILSSDAYVELHEVCSFNSYDDIVFYAMPHEKYYVIADISDYDRETGVSLDVSIEDVPVLTVGVPDEHVISAFYDGGSYYYRVDIEEPGYYYFECRRTENWAGIEVCLEDIGNRERYGSEGRRYFEPGTYYLYIYPEWYGFAEGETVRTAIYKIPEYTVDEAGVHYIPVSTEYETHIKITAPSGTVVRVTVPEEDYNELYFGSPDGGYYADFRYCEDGRHELMFMPQNEDGCVIIRLYGEDGASFTRDLAITVEYEPLITVSANGETNAQSVGAGEEGTWLSFTAPESGEYYFNLPGDSIRFYYGTYLDGSADYWYSYIRNMEAGSTVYFRLVDRDENGEVSVCVRSVSEMTSTVTAGQTVTLPCGSDYGEYNFYTFVPEKDGTYAIMLDSNLNWRVDRIEYYEEEELEEILEEDILQPDGKYVGKLYLRNVKEIRLRITSYSDGGSFVIDTYDSFGFLTRDDIDRVDFGSQVRMENRNGWWSSHYDGSGSWVSYYRYNTELPGTFTVYFTDPEIPPYTVTDGYIEYNGYKYRFEYYSYGEIADQNVAWEAGNIYTVQYKLECFDWRRDFEVPFEIVGYPSSFVAEDVCFVSGLGMKYVPEFLTAYTENGTELEFRLSGYGCYWDNPIKYEISYCNDMLETELYFFFSAATYLEDYPEGEYEIVMYPSDDYGEETGSASYRFTVVSYADIASDIALGETVTVDTAKAFRFVPEEDGVYYFRSYCNYGYVYDIYGGIVNAESVNGDDYLGGYALRIDAVAGEPVYLYANSNSFRRSGSYTVCVERESDLFASCVAVGETVTVDVEPGIPALVYFEVGESGFYDITGISGVDARIYCVGERRLDCRSYETDAEMLYEGERYVLVLRSDTAVQVGIGVEKTVVEEIACGVYGLGFSDDRYRALFSFTAPADGLYVFSAGADEGSGSLAIRIISFNYDTVDEYYGEALCYMDSGRTYYVYVIREWWDGDVSLLALTVNEFAPEDVYAGEEYSAVTTEPDEYVWYRFVPENTALYVFETRGENEGCCVTLYNRYHTVVAYEYNSLEYVCSAGETYYISVRNEYGYTGGISLAVTEKEFPELVIGETAYAEITQEGAYAYFRFNIEEAGVYTFDAGTGNIRLQILNQYMETITGSYFASIDDIWLEPGIYLLRVRFRYSSSTGVIAVESSIKEDEEIFIGENYFELTENGTYFSFTAPEYGMYSFSVSYRDFEINEFTLYRGGESYGASEFRLDRREALMALEAGETVRLRVSGWNYGDEECCLKIEYSELPELELGVTSTVYSRYPEIGFLSFTAPEDGFYVFTGAAFIALGDFYGYNWHKGEQNRLRYYMHAGDRVCLYVQHGDGDTVINCELMALDFTALTLGESVTFESAEGKEIFFSFTPEADGRYVLTEEYGDSYYGIVAYNGSFEEMGYNYWFRGDGVRKNVYYLDAGQKYYFTVTPYVSGTVVRFTVTEFDISDYLTADDIDHIECEGVKVIEHTNGWLESYEDENGNEVSRYWYNVPRPQYFTLYFTDPSLEPVTVRNDSAFTFKGLDYSLWASSLDCDQDTEWTVGGTYEVTAYLGGLVDSDVRFTYTVEIIPAPVEARIDDVTCVTGSELFDMLPQTVTFITADGGELTAYLRAEDWWQGYDGRYYYSVYYGFSPEVNDRTVRLNFRAPEDYYDFSDLPAGVYAIDVTVTDNDNNLILEGVSYTLNVAAFETVATELTLGEVVEVSGDGTFYFVIPESGQYVFRSFSGESVYGGGYPYGGEGYDDIFGGFSYVFTGYTGFTVRLAAYDKANTGETYKVVVQRLDDLYDADVYCGGSAQAELVPGELVIYRLVFKDPGFYDVNFESDGAFKGALYVDWLEHYMDIDGDVTLMGGTYYYLALSSDAACSVGFTVTAAELPVIELDTDTVIPAGESYGTYYRIPAEEPGFYSVTAYTADGRDVYICFDDGYMVYGAGGGGSCNHDVFLINSYDIGHTYIYVETFGDADVMVRISYVAPVDLAEGLDYTVAFGAEHDLSVFAFVPERTAFYKVFPASDVDTRLYVFNADFWSTASGSADLQVKLYEGETYYFVFGYDGYDASCPVFDFHISAVGGSYEYIDACDSYVWIDADYYDGTSFNMIVPGEAIAGSERITVKAKVYFGDIGTYEEGLGYVNVYSYSDIDHIDNFDYLINFCDFADSRVGLTGSWAEYSYTFDPRDASYAMSRGSTMVDVIDGKADPAALTIGFGLYHAYGLVRVAGVTVLDADTGEVLYEYDFADFSYDEAFRAHALNREDEGRLWGVVGGDNIPDYDGDGYVTSDDAVYLLRYTLFPQYYPVFGNCDFDGDGIVTSDDAVYLLRYTLFPDYYPIN